MSIIEFGKSLPPEAVNATVVGHGAIGLSNEKQLAVDTINSDYWLKAEAQDASKSNMMRINLIPEVELWACARKNPKGKFLTRHMSNEAFRNKWKYTEPDSEDDDSLNEALDKKLQTLRKKYKLRKIHKEAVWFARAIGRALVHKFPFKPITKPKGDWYLRVTHIEEQRIFYDKDGIITHYQPSIYIGREMHDFKIPAADCILYVNNPDPNGNGYEGISELESAYFPLLWMSNILATWAEIMEKRGLGILDITIDGADKPTLEEYKEKYGDPSKYTVIFHDEKWHVAAPAAVSPQYNLDTMISVYTKEIASSGAVGEARMTGVQQGAVTGGNLDADSFGQTLGGIQQEWDDNCIALHVLCDPSVNEKFGILYDLSIRLDRKQVIENFGNAINGVNQGLDFLTYNQALALLDKPTVSDGDMLASKWIATHIDYDDIVKVGGKMPDSGTIAPNEAQENINQEKKNEKRNETEIKKPNRKAADAPSRKEISNLKRTKAKELLIAKDSEGYPLSLKDINILIKNEFGSGLSYSTLNDLRAS